MKVCEICGEEIGGGDGENRCERCENREVTRKVRNQARRGREEALRSCGLVKVRGALGGVYWE